MKSALLVIDVQRALCQGDYAAFEAERVIQRINLVAGKARAAGVPVVFIQHEANDGLLEPDTDGWRLAEGLDALESDLYLRKKASDAFHQTSLGATLQELGVTDLVICGLQSEFCVDTTTRRALALGYPVILVADGHSTMDNAVLSADQISRHHTHTLTNLSSFGVRARALSAAALRFDI
ncbi:cysteine hydrolase family protein [soil metagenome]